jgi:hypothetical protein
VASIAAGVMAVLGVMHVYQTQIRPFQQRAVLASPLALVDLQPEPAEESLKPIDFQKNKHAIVRSSARFSACVDAAATVDEGVWCMGQLLAVLPRPLEKRALEVAKEVYPSKHVVGDPKILAMKLETCLTHASERDGAVFCVSDLLAHVPPAVINKAVELGEEHPAFDWEDGHAAAVHDAAVFNTCVDTAGNVEEGVLCLGSLLTQLPEAMVERSVRITSELPPPNQPAEEPQMLSKDFVYCLEIAETRDAATYCLAHFLGRLPDEQVSCLFCDDTREFLRCCPPAAQHTQPHALRCHSVVQVHEAYLYAKSHRGRGRPFLTEFEENEDMISEKEQHVIAKSQETGLPGLGFGVGAHEELTGETDENNDDLDGVTDERELAKAGDAQGDNAMTIKERIAAKAADLQHHLSEWKKVGDAKKLEVEAVARRRAAAAAAAKVEAARRTGMATKSKRVIKDLAARVQERLGQARKAASQRR